MKYIDKLGYELDDGDIVLNDNGLYYNVRISNTEAVITTGAGMVVSTLEAEKSYITRVSNVTCELNRLVSEKNDMRVSVKQLAVEMNRLIS